ncbi:sigma-70 family RNA polymerase sigma factor [Peribacillus frigoritolerans]|uniref:sigma-70 family RNA polymerase sigma factor n=1 Tax=Peribacillus frigoritolerans TaxID=450367 RepID=UPI00315CD749
MNKSDCCSNQLFEYENNNRKFINSKIIKSFLKEEKNYALYKKAICNPSIENKNKLDEEFKKHLFYIRFVSLISKTIHFTAVKYDISINDQNKNFPIILNAENDESIPLLDTIEVKEEGYEKIYNGDAETTEDITSDKEIANALSQLTNTQKKTLKLKYVDNLAFKEIAVIMNVSQQAVSKNHKLAINKLRNLLQEK